MVYNRINQSLYDFIYFKRKNGDYDYISLDQLVLSERFCDIILKNFSSSYVETRTKFKTKISKEKSIKYSKEFLESLDPNYSLRLLKNIDDEILNFSLSECISQANVFSNQGKNSINIPLRNNIIDSLIITHEQIHEVIMNGDNTPVWSYFVEVPSLLSELLQVDYFKQYGFSSSELRNHKKDLISSILKRTLRLKVQIHMIKNILTYGYTDEFLMADICNELYAICENEELVMDCVDISVIKLFGEDDECFYFFDLRYIVGSVLAFYLHDIILNKPELKKEFAGYNEIFSYYSFRNVFESMGLEFKENAKFDLTEESYKKLEKSYKREINRN